MKMFATCFSTARSVTTRAAAMPELDIPSAIRWSTSRSRGVNEPRTSRAAAGAQQLGDDLGIERGSARPDPDQRVDELADVGDAVLEQVPDTAGRPGEQLGGVTRLDVLREHEHADIRMRVP